MVIPVAVYTLLTLITKVTGWVFIGGYARDVSTGVTDAIIADEKTEQEAEKTAAKMSDNLMIRELLDSGLTEEAVTEIISGHYEVRKKQAEVDKADTEADETDNDDFDWNRNVQYAIIGVLIVIVIWVIINKKG